MPSWLSRLAEGTTADEAMLRRFVETSRRAEIVAMVNSARSIGEIAEAVASELCEAYEAEVAFVLIAQAEAPPEVAASVGLSEEDRARLLRDPLCVGGLDAERVRVEQAEDLLGIGARVLALAPFAGESRDRALVGVARLYERPFDEAEIALLESVTLSAGHALARTWLAGERERYAAQQAAVARAAKLLNVSLKLDEVLDTLCREVAVGLDADVVSVFFADEDGGLMAVAAHGLPQSFIGFRQPPGEGLSGRAVATGRAQVSNAYQEEGYAPSSTAVFGRIRCGIAVPLRRRGRVDGAISVGFESERWLGRAEVELLTAFADLAGAACQNAADHADAQRAATHDSLTGCLNHAAFQTRLREEISRSERGGEPFTLVLLDLVDFKSINECFGHLTGDTVLRTVGELLRGAVRLHDQVARFGGDEFALLLPSAGEVEGRPVVDRALESLGEAPLPGGERLGVRAGIAEWIPGEQATALLERADHVLREAKREGAAERAVRAATDVAPPDHEILGADEHTRRAERRMRKLATAASIGTRLSRLLEPGPIAAMAIEELHQTLGYERCEVLRLDGNAVTVVASVGGPDNGDGAERSNPQDEGAVGRCLRERRPVLVTDARRDPLYAAAAAVDGMGSELAIPLYAGSKLWGAIDLRSGDPERFDESDAQLVQTVADYVGAALRTAELYRRLEETYLGTAEALAAALEAKDDYTADHARSIADLAVAVGRELALSEPDLRDLRYGAIFHDIGKIAVPDAILNKPGPLSDEEFEIVKRHPIAGEQILAPVPFLANVRRIVRHDHERWDGTGYPDGLRGPQIPIGARIVFVVDAYHAMISDRPYRKGLPPEKARGELLDNAGSQFDSEVVEALLTVLDREPSGWYAQ